MSHGGDFSVYAMVSGQRRRIALDSWDFEHAMRTLFDVPTTNLFVTSNGSASITLEHVPEVGFYISAFAQGDLVERIAEDPDLTLEPVEVLLGDHRKALPRRIFVSAAQARLVLEHFLKTCLLSPGVSWRPSKEWMRAQ